MEHLNINRTQPMNNDKILDYITLFFTSINGAFVFISHTDLNFLTAILGLFFLVVRNTRFVLVLLYDICLFLFYKSHRSKIANTWRKELEQRNKTDEDKDEQKK